MMSPDGTCAKGPQCGILGLPFPAKPSSDCPDVSSSVVDTGRTKRSMSVYTTVRQTRDPSSQPGIFRVGRPCFCVF